MYTHTENTPAYLKMPTVMRPLYSTQYAACRPHEKTSEHGQNRVIVYNVRGATQKFPKFECRSLTT
jgi:hypothetical protein